MKKSLKLTKPASFKKTNALGRRARQRAVAPALVWGREPGGARRGQTGPKGAQNPKRAPPPHTARVALGAWRSSGGSPRAKNKFCPLPHTLSLSLSLSLSHSLQAELWRWGPIARTKTDRKNKNHAASPTSHSARGPGGVAQLGRQPRAKNNCCPLPHSLSHSL